uniref:Uncharacterized protein n=1 Tax=Anopheles minimus TaxID=112268 RepID=A0A182WNV3_9DIPT
MCKLIGSMCVQ